MPIAIAAVGVQVSVEALIAAGAVSVGALAFSLVDMFGQDADDAIEGAIPTQSFEDSGPIGQAGIPEMIAGLLQPPFGVALEVTD